MRGAFFSFSLFREQSGGVGTLTPSLSTGGEGIEHFSGWRIGEGHEHWEGGA